MYFDKLQLRFKEQRLVPSEQIRSCTSDEVQLLEQTLRIHFPKAYEEFLLWMGKGAGAFLQGSDCFYADLPKLKDWAKELLAENDATLELAEEAFVFFIHQGYQFAFMLISEGDNPPVYYYNETQDPNAFTPAYENYVAFLADQVESFAQNRNREV
jgi:hypothetical protein